MTDPIVNAENEKVEEALKDPSKEHPETVSWSQFVGTREKAHKAEAKLNDQITSLNEQIKGATSKEDFEKLQTELTDTKTQLDTVTTELNTNKAATLTEKRAVLIAKGVSEEKVKDMSVKELDAILGVVGSIKIEADMGGGGAGAGLQGTPMELSRQAYSSK